MVSSRKQGSIQYRADFLDKTSIYQYLCEFGSKRGVEGLGFRLMFCPTILDCTRKTEMLE